MRGNVVETLIGAVVVAVAAFFLVFAYRTAGVASVGGYEVIAKFDRVDGLTIGSDVRMSGIKIGTIVGQSLDPQTYRAVVRFTVDSAIPLPDDSSAKIASSGLLGPNYLSVEPGGSDDLIRPGGEVKYTQGAVNLLDLIAQAIFSATGAGGTAKDGGG
ncbi:MAG: outer membrane lipid asymmetry maintenance protein MlaD [Alphaproteobacteria bacterium]|nr:outer membrane lipid asymmetry maintenance protein MlaD [Alphaproteobacteria bacterium]MCW5749639.1 outer membrane lipid asymmetry maintenance protein MlaD [Alphaproteobacteria bacterium]